MTAVYCAPVTRPFRYLHIAEPGADFHAPAGCEALTACGLVMVRADIWLAIDRQEGDLVCPVCAGGDRPLQLVLSAEGEAEWPG